MICTTNMIMFHLMCCWDTGEHLLTIDVRRLLAQTLLSKLTLPIPLTSSSYGIQKSYELDRFGVSEFLLRICCDGRSCGELQRLWIGILLVFFFQWLTIDDDVQLSEPYVCGYCGRKCKTNKKFKKHFRDLHERERNKRMNRLNLLKGGKRDNFKPVYRASWKPSQLQH